MPRHKRYTGKQTRIIAIIILDNTNKWAGLVLNGMEQVRYYQRAIRRSFARQL